MPKTCILIPAYNCSHAIAEVCRRVSLQPRDEIIIVDDASTDGTYEAASRIPRTHVSRNVRNLGYGGTSRRLYELALEREATVAVNLHGDLGHRPEDARLLRDALIARGWDVAVGSRLLHIHEAMRRAGWYQTLTGRVDLGMPWDRLAGHVVLTAFQNACLGTNLRSFHEGMRAVTRPVMEWIVSADLPQWYDFDMQLLIRLIDTSFAIGEVPVAPYYDSHARTAAPRVRYGLRVVRTTVRAAWSRTRLRR